MRPLRWGLPVAVLLLLAPVLTSQATGEDAREPYYESFLLAPPLACDVVDLDPCTLDDGAWTTFLVSDDGLTTVVLEGRSEPLRSPVRNTPLWMVVELVPPDGGDPLVNVITLGSSILARHAVTFDAPLAAGAWTLRAHPYLLFATEPPGSYNLLHVGGLRVAVTFAYRDYALPDDFSAFPPDPGASESQTLLGNVGLGTDILPCASTSSIPRTPPESSSLAAQGRSLPRSPAGLLVSPTKTC